MKQLIIIGARGFGREVYSLAKRAIGYNETFVIKGFLDDKRDALDSFEKYPLILASVENYKIQVNDIFICALGSVESKKYYANIILSKGGTFFSLIDKTVVLGENCQIGVGCTICAFVVISNDVKIDDFVTIHPSVIIGHDVSIGNHVHVGAYCFFGGFTVIEDEVAIYVRATIFDRVRIGKQAVIGAGVSVRKNVVEKVVTIR